MRWTNIAAQRPPFAAWLESETPKAMAALRRMMDNLEDYLAQQAGSLADGRGEAGERETGEITESIPEGPSAFASFSLSPFLPCSRLPPGATVNPATNSPANPAGGEP